MNFLIPLFAILFHPAVDGIPDQFNDIAISPARTLRVGGFLQAGAASPLRCAPGCIVACNPFKDLVDYGNPFLVNFIKEWTFSQLLCRRRDRRVAFEACPERTNGRSRFPKFFMVRLIRRRV